MTLASATVVTLGEALLRLTTPPGERLAEAARLDVHVAGAEANVAAALAQLGVPTRWISRLPAGPLGRRVERELAGLGVLTDAVQWADDDDDRLGLFFAEPGSGVRPTTVWYDRRHSTFAAMRTLPADAARDARIVHVSGITRALGEGPAALVDELADGSNARLSLDVNYRSRLWAPDAARRDLGPLLERAAIVFCAERDARTVFGLDGDGVLAGLAELAPAHELVVMTRGAAGCVAVDATGRRYEQAAPATPIVDRFGMGDAFVAGVVYGVLEDDVALGLRAGVALAALKASLRGDFVRLEPGELEGLVENPDALPEVVR